MKKFYLVVFLFALFLFLLPFTTYSADQIFTDLRKIAVQGKIEKDTFYLNSKSCSTKNNLHVAYYQKNDVLVFGYFDSQTGMIKNYIWNKSKGETSILSRRFDEIVDPKEAIKISEKEIEDQAIKFRTSWIGCK